MRNGKNELLRSMEPVEVYKKILAKEIRQFPYHYWEEGEISIDRANKCIVYLIKDVLKWDKEDIYNNFTYDTFNSYGLKNMVRICFKEKYHYALQSAFPEMDLKAWLYKTVTPRNYWTRENFIEALRWTLEERHKVSKFRLPKVINEQFMKDNGLLTGYQKFCNSCAFNALDAVYPGAFEAFQLKKVPKGYWNKIRAIDALVWRCSHTPMTIDDVTKKVGYKFIRKAKLEHQLYEYFDGCSARMVDAAYPGIYNLKNKNMRVKDVYYNEMPMYLSDEFDDYAL